MQRCASAGHPEKPTVVLVAQSVFSYVRKREVTQKVASRFFRGNRSSYNRRIKRLVLVFSEEKRQFTAWQTV